MWPVRGHAAGQGMVFDISVLNRVYNFMQICPKQGMVNTMVDVKHRVYSRHLLVFETR